VKVWQLDLGSSASVIAFAERCEKELDRLDIVLENAGISTSKFELVEDNESTITVNVISTFLLAHLLVPKLKETARKYNIRPVIAIMASGVGVHKHKRAQ
jgi:retinol dehydrogenase-12